MRKFLAAATALGLLAATVPASAQTTANPPTRTAVAPKAKSVVVAKKPGKMHLTKRFQLKRFASKVRGKFHVAKHLRRNHMAKSKVRQHARPMIKKSKRAA
jgi:hypothetical protein